MKKSTIKINKENAEQVYREASKAYNNLSATINLLREEWQGVLVALKLVSANKANHLVGLKLLERELRGKYYEVRLESWELYHRKQAAMAVINGKKK